MPKVSICIPSYNQSYFLRKNLTSVISQTFTDYEIIITDDSTTTEVKELINEFDFNGKLQYYHNEYPLGSPRNWNYCISKASGEYIKIMHHDDWFSTSTSLQSIVALLESSPKYDLVFCGCNNISIDGKQLFNHHINKEQYITLLSCPEVLFQSNLIGAPSVLLYKRNVDIKFDEKISYMVDIEFYIQLLKGGKEFTYTTEALVNIGHSSSQVTHTVINNKNKMIFEYSYAFQKLEHTKKAFPFYYETFWKLITDIDISSANELVELGWVGEIPAFILWCIRGNNFLKLFRNNGTVSKLIKSGFYLCSINSNRYKTSKRQ